MTPLATRLRSGLGRLALTLCSILGACGGDTSLYAVTGTVQAVDTPASQLYVAHDVIPGFMPAMTMNFDVADPRELSDLQPGDRIRFELERTSTSLRVLQIQRLGATGGGVGRGGAIEASAPEVAPPFELIDHEGQTFHSDRLRGHAVVLDFIFTRCEGPCPILTARHVAVQRSLSEQLRACTRFVSISVDPEHDRPEILRDYALSRGADLATWSFLTGEASVVRSVLSAYGIGATSTEALNIEHTVATFLIDTRGHIVRRYLGLSAAAADIEEDLDVLCTNGSR